MALLYQTSLCRVSTHGWALLTPFILMGTRYGVVAIELLAVGATHSPKPQGEGLPTAPTQTSWIETYRNGFKVEFLRQCLHPHVLWA